MEAHGQLVPVIVVRNEPRYTLIDGERRWRAKQLGGGNGKLKAIILGELPTATKLLGIQASLDFHHAPLRWGERIDLVARIQDETGCTINDLAALLHISQPFTTKLLRIRRVAPQVREMLDAGKIEFEKAYILSGEPDHAKQLELLKEAYDLTRDQLRQKTRSEGGSVEVRTSVARFPLVSGMQVTVQGKQLTLARVIEALLETLRELKKGQSQHLDVTTLGRVMRDRAMVQP